MGEIGADETRAAGDQNRFAVPAPVSVAIRRTTGQSGLRVPVVFGAVFGMFDCHTVKPLAESSALA